MFNRNNNTNRSTFNLLAALAAASLAALAGAEPPAVPEVPEETLDWSTGGEEVLDWSGGGEEFGDDAIEPLIFSPCDTDTDGKVDELDYMDYIHALLKGDVKADFNKDSVLESQDFYEFIDCLLSTAVEK